MPDRQPNVDDVTEFPVPLDNLIAYVKSLHPEGGPLDNVSDAVRVAARLDEQSDALLGYFVDQARRSGASWSQIGTSMGVSKQAAQKRFVPREPTWHEFSRFTQRARNTIAAAARAAGDGQPVGASLLAAGLLAEPEGLAARAVHAAGLNDEQFRAALRTPAVPPAARDADAAALRELEFTASGGAVLKGALKAALRLGHYYIGTEHLLLGALYAGGDTADALISCGLAPETAERLLAAEFARIQAERKAAAWTRPGSAGR